MSKTSTLSLFLPPFRFLSVCPHTQYQYNMLAPTRIFFSLNLWGSALLAAIYSPNLGDLGKFIDFSPQMFRGKNSRPGHGLSNDPIIVGLGLCRYRHGRRAVRMEGPLADAYIGLQHNLLLHVCLKSANGRDLTERATMGVHAVVSGRNYDILAPIIAHSHVVVKTIPWLVPALCFYESKWHRGK